jgi:hypothetical protein
MKIDAARGDLLATNKRGRRPPDRAARSAWEQEEPVNGRSFVTKKRRIGRPATTKWTKCKEKIRGKRGNTNI